MSKKYFVDKDHAVMTDYYDFLDVGEENQAKVEKQMKEFIKKDPLFLDPYLILFELYQSKKDIKSGEQILEDAFQIAIKTIADRKGIWPEEMAWGHLENRHIIRTLLNKAMNLWAHGENEPALDLLRKLLRSNPRDNIGARNYILAIRLGMTFAEFETQMASEYGYDGKKMMEFEEKMRKFPDEFDWWFKAVNEEN
jgi:tetratricopeptide (TPR) repeat protein